MATRGEAVTGSEIGRGRDPTLDILRGLAIAIMIFGHLAISVLSPLETGIGYIEIVCGAAPPLFLVVSGMLVAHAAGRTGSSLRRPLLRCAQIFAVAALIDVFVWRVLPFVTVDVLYLIGVSLPVAYLASTRLPRWAPWALAALFIFSAPLLQDWLGYSIYPTEYERNGELVTEIDMEDLGTVALSPHANVLYNWIFDGWFPLFPWLGFSLLGVAAAQLRWRAGALHSAGVAVALPALALLALGWQLGWISTDFVLTPRVRWGGAFMPPRWGYLVASLGSTALLFVLVDRRPQLSVLRPLGLLGRHALVIYAGHLALLWLIGEAIDERLAFGLYLAIYAGLLALFLALALAIDTIQQRGRNAEREGPSVPEQARPGIRASR